ncbi:hypothetical protein NT6N_14270 [Oceaniferula spumae]|uniref:DUF5666 domain-containing protein n=1 Tax=Oceaniferula spumae TaxID=2979115 RepID=A0AAT9FKB0_9BACT
MKVKHLIAMVLMAVALPSQALEQREFFSADKSKSFKATLTGYNSKTKTVTVSVGPGRSKHFSLDVLSPECQKYVLANEAGLAIAKNVRLTIEEDKGLKNGDEVPTGYSIEVRNNGKVTVDNVSLKYTLYYDQGDLVRGGIISKTKEGTLATGKLYSSDTITVATDKVGIVRKIKAPSGGG